MVSKTIIVIAAICFCQALARPGGEPQDNFQRLSQGFEQTMDTLKSEFQKVFDLKETKESKKINEDIKANANILAGKLSDLMTDLNKEINAHSGDAKAALENLQTKLSENVEKLKKDYPAEASKAQEYQKQIESSYAAIQKNVQEAVSKVAKDTSGISEDAHKLFENLMTQVKTNAEKINQDLKKTLDEHKKEHKH